MNTKSVTNLSMLGIAMALLAGCAAQPGPAQVADTKPVDATAAQCEQVTGSRIHNTSKENCSPVGYPIRSYSSDEINSTGEIGVGEALRTLDPSFR